MAAWNLDGHVFRNNLERRARETSVNCLLRDIYIYTHDRFLLYDPSCCKDCSSLSIFLFFEKRLYLLDRVIDDTFHMEMQDYNYEEE